MDKEKFTRARIRALEENGEGYQGIGRLSEKTMHRMLKLYYEPDESLHEIECFGSVADVKNDGGIIEIQRASLAYLIPKLERFLPHSPVTVVHPIVAKKRVRRLNTETGEITSSGRTVKGKTVFDSAFEIYKIRKFIGNEGFTLILLLLDCDEYKVHDPRARRGRGGDHRVECIPTDVIAEYILCDPTDYLALLPDDLADGFTAEEFKKSVKSRSRYAYYYLRLLVDLGLMTREKQGAKYLYSRIKK
ncbi:MAG: hypothetical protein IKV43_00620 [Clostridia bacterium]|nr:hypothetical protein [Clostridia bacterium]